MRDYDLDIDTGKGRFVPAADRPVDVGAFRAAFREAGFELLGLEARVRGSVSAGAGDGPPVLEAAETGQSFRLEGARERLGGVEASRQVVVTGSIDLEKEGPPTLAVHSLEPVSPGPRDR